MRKLLVEITAQPIELLGLAQVFGGDDLVVPGDEWPVIRAARLVLAMPARTPRLRRCLGVTHFRVVRAFCRKRLGRVGRSIGHVLGGGVRLLDLGLRVLAVGSLPLFAGFLLPAILLALLTFLLV